MRYNMLIGDMVATPFAHRQDIVFMNRQKSSPPPPSRRTEPNPLYVGSVEKAFDVLKAFRRGQAEFGLRDLGLSEIARLAEMDKSAAQRFTSTLVALDYLAKDPITRRYRPAVNLADLYFTYVISNRLAEIAMPRLIEAGKVYDTTVNLCELSGTDIIYTIRIPHEKARFEATIAGRRVPAFCAAGGNVILAHLPDTEREAIIDASPLRPLTDETIVDPAAIRARIARARRTMFDIGVNQAMMHEISTAAPVFNAEGKVVAAVQIPVYSPQWSLADARRKIVPLAVETARAISGSL